jgi:hypothetical protein
MSNPVEAVKLAFTKYTPVSVTTVAVFVCVVALVVALAVAYGPNSQKNVIDPKKYPSGTNSDSADTSSDFIGSLFTKYLGWSVTAIVVVVLLIGGIGFGGFKIHQYRTSAAEEAKALDDLLTKFSTLITERKLQYTDNFVFSGAEFKDYGTAKLFSGSEIFKLNLETLVRNPFDDGALDEEEDVEDETDVDKETKVSIFKRLNKALHDGPFLVTRCKQNRVEVVCMKREKLIDYLSSYKKDTDRKEALRVLISSFEFFSWRQTSSN